MKRFLSAGIAFVVAANFCMAQSRPASSPASTSVPASSPVKTKIIPGPDTTRITSPLRPDGTVDYVAALNAEASKGVTKDNNAAVLLLDVLGPDFLPEEVRQKVYKALDITPDPKTPVFDDSMAGDPKYGSLQSKPWQEKDNLDAATWLKNNAKALDLIVEASKRTQWYVPMVGEDENPSIYEIAMPSLQKYRYAARTLAMRANLAIAEGRNDDAWADIQAAYRLAALIGQDSTQIARLVAISCSSIADAAACNLAVWGKLDAKTARTMLAQLQSLGKAPSTIATIDQEQRYFPLDMISTTSVMPPHNIIADFTKGTPTSELLNAAAWDFIVKHTDWNVVLRHANKQYDRFVAILNMTDLDERQKALAVFETNLQKMREDAKNIPEDDSQKIPWFAKSFTNYLISILTPGLARTQTLSEIAGVRRQLTSVAFALAAYKADKGKYPAKLADLSPDYLKEVPKDFFAGGKDLIYKPDGGGYILYSVGDNRQDDGGKDKSQNGDDLVVKAEGK